MYIINYYEWIISRKEKKTIMDGWELVTVDPQSSTIH